MRDLIRLGYADNRLFWAEATQICDKYPTLMCNLYILGQYNQLY